MWICVSCLLNNSWIKLFSQPDSLENYITNVGCVWYYHYWIILPIDFLYHFSSGDYLFFYAYDDNNVVGLMQPTPQRAYTPEVEILYEYVVDTMVDDLVEAMED